MLWSSLHLQVNINAKTQPLCVTASQQFCRPTPLDLTTLIVNKRARWGGGGCPGVPSFTNRGMACANMGNRTCARLPVGANHVRCSNYVHFLFILTAFQFSYIVHFGFHVVLFSFSSFCKQAHILDILRVWLRKSHKHTTNVHKCA